MISSAILRGFFLLCLVGGCVAFGAAGDLDQSFGNAGTVVEDFDTKVDTYGYSTLSADCVAVRDDGKIVVLGSTYDGFHINGVLACYGADGSPDPGFGQMGKVILADELDAGNFKSLVLQPDGKILVALAGLRQQRQTVTIARYKSNGTLDPDFNGYGMASRTYFEASGLDVSSLNKVSLTLAPDGKIFMGVIAVHGVNARHIYSYALFFARFNPNGLLDTTFNRTGELEIEAGGLAAAVQEDGKLLVLNSLGAGELSLSRLGPTGKPDRTFGRGGKTRFTPLGTSAQFLDANLTIQRDGKILVGAGSGGLTSVTRLTATGALDKEFNGTGTATTGLYSQRVTMAVQEDGKILIAGSALTVARFKASGGLDSSFGTNGKTATNSAPDVDGHAVALQPDGRIVAVGEYDSNVYDEKGHIALARYLNDPELPAVTQAATDVGATSAKLHGTVDPNGESGVTAAFEWGLAPDQLTNLTPILSVAVGADPVAVETTVPGLQEGMIYYYRVRSGMGPDFTPQYGEVLNFATITYQQPVVFSRPATTLTATGAVLQASVSPNGVPTSVHFEWGTSTGYGYVTADTNLAAGTAAVGVSAPLSGLTTDQTYHFRAVATSVEGTTTGADRTFVPNASAPQPQDDVVLVDGTVNVPVLTNDSDPNSSALTLVSVDQEAPAQHGTPQIVGNAIAYTPEPGMLVDEFSYVVRNATGQTAKATVHAYRLSEIRGGYYGVLAGSGQLNLGMGPTGAFSMRLTWQGEEYAVMARLSSSGSVVVPIAGKRTQQGRTLTLTIQFDPVTGTMLVQLMDSVLGGPFEIAVPRSGEADDEVDAVRGALYTTTIDVPDMAPPEGPEELVGFADKFRGSGFASVKIAKNRSARFVGQMPDTAKFSAGSAVSRRTYAFYSALYRVKRGALGSVSGQAALQSNFELRSTSLNWQRQSDDRDAIFSGAFNTPAFLTGDRYTPPTRGQLLQIGLELLSGAFSNANVDMTLGGLVPEFSQRLKFVPGSVRVVGENPSKVKLKISPATGTFSGSFVHDVSQKVTKYSGIFITSAFQIREGRGSFRGEGAGGKVRIAKP
jgi:uncharacterized delta-60 repeat protein